MKIEPSQFRIVSIGDFTLMFRPSMARRIADSFGNASNVIVAGCLLMQPGKKKATTFAPATVQFRADKATLTDLHTDAIQGVWMAAGVLLGERFMSFDKQPKLRVGDAPFVIMRRKRTDDFKHSFSLWKAWNEWRESGAKQTFEVFRFGPVKDTDTYRSTSRAAVQLLASIGLSVSRKFQD